MDNIVLNALKFQLKRIEWNKHLTEPEKKRKAAPIKKEIAKLEKVK